MVYKLKYILISIFLLFLSGCSGTSVGFTDVNVTNQIFTGDVNASYNSTTTVLEVGGVTVNLSSYNTDNQTLSLNGNILSIFNGNSVNLSNISGGGGGGGDITGVFGGYGLYNGSSSGDVYLAINTSLIQNRINASCPSGSSIRAVGIDGNVTCETDSTGTNNYVNGVTFDGEILTLTRSGLSSLSTTINLSNFYNKSQSDALYLSVNGGTITGNLTVTQHIKANSLHINYSSNEGVSYPANINMLINQSNTPAINIASKNRLMSSVWISGEENDTGTLKITHKNSDGFVDSVASIISILAQGVVTSVKGLFIDMGNSTGDAIQIINESQEIFVVEADGDINAKSDIYLNDDIIREGDTNTVIQGSSDQWNFVTGASSRLTINNNGVKVVNGNLDLNLNNITEIDYIQASNWSNVNISISQVYDYIASSSNSSCPNGMQCPTTYSELKTLLDNQVSPIWLLGNTTYTVDSNDLTITVNTDVYGNGATIRYNSTVCADGGGEIHYDTATVNLTWVNTIFEANGCGTYLFDGLDNDDDHLILRDNVFTGFVQANVFHRGSYIDVSNNFDYNGGKFISADYEGDGLTCIFNNNYYYGNASLPYDEREVFDCNSHRLGYMQSINNLLWYGGENYIEANVGNFHIINNIIYDDPNNLHSNIITFAADTSNFSSGVVANNQLYQISKNSKAISGFGYSNADNNVEIYNNVIYYVNNTNSTISAIRLDAQFNKYSIYNNYINGSYLPIEVGNTNGQILFNRYDNTGGSVNVSGSPLLRCDIDVCSDFSGGGGGSSNFTGTTNGIRISNSGYDPYAFYVMRNSSITESVKVNVTDSTAVFTSIQDEPANKLGNYLFNANAFTIGSNSLPTNFTNVFGTGGLTRFCRDSGSQCFKFYGDSSLNSLYTQNKPFDFGTEDNYNLNIQTNGTDAIIIDTNQLVNITTRLTTRFYYEGDDYVCLGNMSGVC